MNLNNFSNFSVCFQTEKMCPPDGHMLVFRLQMRQRDNAGRNVWLFWAVLIKLTLHQPTRLTCMVFSQFFSLLMPALLITMSRRPNLSTVLWNASVAQKQKAVSEDISPGSQTVWAKWHFLIILTELKATLKLFYIIVRLWWSLSTEGQEESLPLPSHLSVNPSGQQTGLNTASEIGGGQFEDRG